jgi:hypothetical protein
VPADAHVLDVVFALKSQTVANPETACYCVPYVLLQVPADAHVLDVVFADSESMQSFHDDNGGLDYHIPIEGGKGVMPGLKVRLHAGAALCATACSIEAVARPQSVAAASPHAAASCHPDA